MVTVTIIYPTDPLGVVPGGTDTCIRDILKCAPKDMRMRLIGVTTDRLKRPLKRWTMCELAGRKFDFYPVVAVSDLLKQMKIPLSLKFTLGLLCDAAWKDSDILQFHRLEPALLFYKKPIRKITVIHQNMKVINDNSSDIRWKYLPGLYFKLEDIVLPKFDEIRIVREDAVKDYQERYPNKKEHITFLPTWMNPDLFFISDVGEREVVRSELLNTHGWPINSLLMISVGRLDYQKNPLLALEAFASLVVKYPSLKYVMVGDGVLREDVENKISNLGLQGSVALLGAKSQEDVARILRSCNMMLLSSAYEGMPRCVVESLGCGVPVVSTDVGEVRLLIHPCKNGSIALDHSKQSIIEAVSDCIDNLDKYKGRSCTDAVLKYTARVVLENLYASYRSLSI